MPFEKNAGHRGRPIWRNEVDDMRLELDFQDEFGFCIEHEEFSTMGPPTLVEKSIWLSDEEARELAEFILKMLEEKKSR